MIISLLYRSLSSIFVYSGIIFIISGSHLALALEEKKPLLVFHSGSELIENDYMMALIIELEKKLPHHKLTIVDSRDWTIAQLKAQLEKSKSCVMAIGQKALKTILAARDPTAIFSTLVSKSTLDKLTGSYSRLGSSVTGIYEEQSFKRQLLLAKAINNNIKNIAVILSRETRYLLTQYQKFSKQQSMRLTYEILKHQESPQQSFSRFNINSGFLIILNEEQNYSEQNLRSLLISSYKKNVPMIGAKISDSEHAALASIYTPYKALAEDSALGLQQMCERNQLPEARYSNYYKVLINTQIAKHLDYNHLNEIELEQAVSKLELAKK